MLYSKIFLCDELLATILTQINIKFLKLYELRQTLAAPAAGRGLAHLTVSIAIHTIFSMLYLSNFECIILIVNEYIIFVLVNLNL